METNKALEQAIKAITARDPEAYSVVHHGGNNYSARIGFHAVGYYVIIDGQIVGDVWYE